MGEGGKSSNHAQKKIADNLGGQSMYPVFGRGQKKKSEHLLSKHVCDPAVIAIAGRNQGGISKNKPTIQPAGRCRRSIRMDIKTKLETPASVCVCAGSSQTFFCQLCAETVQITFHPYDPRNWCTCHYC